MAGNETFTEPADRAGTFRAEIIQAYPQAAQSGSWGIYLCVGLTEKLEGAEWEAWEEFCQYSQGAVWIIKKDGTVNEKPSASFAEATGYAGQTDSQQIAAALVGKKVQVSVKADEYNGNVSYKVNWVSPYESEGGGEIDDKQKSTLRAFFGSNAPPPPKAPAPEPAPGK